MNEGTVKRLAVSFKITLLIILVVLVYLVVESWLAERFAETAFLIGISFMLVAEIVYFFERAFTPGETWWTIDGYKAGLIENSPGEEEPPSAEEPSSRKAAD
ncbi:MAG: hypothetical protein ACE5QF_01820 [Thermoplasmata archaeon]